MSFFIYTRNTRNKNQALCGCFLSERLPNTLVFTYHRLCIVLGFGISNVKAGSDRFLAIKQLIFVWRVKQYLDGEFKKYETWKKCRESKSYLFLNLINLSDSKINEQAFSSLKTKGVGRNIILNFLGGKTGDWKETEIRFALRCTEDIKQGKMDIEEVGFKRWKKVEDSKLRPTVPKSNLSDPQASFHYCRSPLTQPFPLKLYYTAKLQRSRQTPIEFSRFARIRIDNLSRGQAWVWAWLWWLCGVRFYIDSKIRARQ